MTNHALAGWRWVSVALVLTWSIQSDAAAAESKTLAGAMPAGAIVYAEVAGLEQVLDRLERSEYLDLLTTSSPFRALEKSPQYRTAHAIRQIVETQLGMDLWTAGRKLLGGRIAVGLYPQEGKKQPDVVALVRVADVKALALFRERLEPFLVLFDEQIDTSQTIAGTKVVGVGGNAFVAFGDEWVAAASTRELLAKALGLLTGKGQAKSSLAADEAFRAMTRQMGSDHLVRTFVNTRTLAQAAGGRFFPAKADNPLVSLLLPGIIELAVRSPFAGWTLDVSEQQFVLTGGVNGDSRKLGQPYQVFFSNPAEAGAPAIPQPKDLIAGFTIHRDFADWYRHREELLQDRVLPGFDKFETGLGNLLPSKDFGEDILPLFGKGLTFLAAPQTYEYLDGEPGVKFPGFAMVIPLAKPDEAEDVLQLFFQNLTAILNIQAGQQGRQPWRMVTETHKGVPISYGKYLKKPSGKRLPMVFNFRPAAARVGDKFIISSSLGLCRQLVDEFQQPKPAGKQINRNLHLEVHLGPLADILEVNQQFFHSRAIQSGRSAQQAKAEFDAVLKILRFFQTVSLSTSVKTDAFQVRLEGSWK